MRLSLGVLTLFICSAMGMFAQSDRGTITGTIVDPAGAVVPNATIEARNNDTGSVFPVASSNTGNYTVAELPAGTYELNVTVPGFKKYIRPGLIVQAAQIIRVDVTLQVGNATESVTVNEEAPLLETENGAVSSTISSQTMNTLPLLEIGTNGAGIRNPYNLLALVPGAYFTPPVPGAVGSPDQINGGKAGSETVLIDGMDATNALGQGADAQAQPGQDQIQEWTVQASNYSAEFGQAGQAVYNVTMKSGTNTYHGSVFESYQNAYLNAGQPFTNNGNGKLVNPANTQNDYGMTFGGPIWIPKVYNGRNRTFFFFNWEQYIRDQYVLGPALDVPTAAYRQGNFAGAIVAAGNRSIGTDPLGGTIFADEIYDPTTARTVNGQVVTTQFPGNAIPLTRLDPIALKVQNLLPQPFCVAGPPCNPLGAVNNFQNTEFEHRQTEVPSLKLDHTISSSDKLSFFWNRTMTYCLTCYGDDGMAQPISDTFGGGIYSKALRLNYDHTLKPTLLLHLGIGYNSDDLGRPLVTPNYPACSNLGLCSSSFTLPSAFPNFTGLLDSTAGGMSNGALTGSIGNTGRTDSIYNQFNAIASLTWVKDNHTFKFGGELRSQGNYSVDHTDLQGSYGFSNAQTAMPYTVTTVSGVSAANIGAYHIGQPYASYLLGLVNTATIDPTSDSRFGKHSLAGYAQDSWKVSRKITLDLGIRYDFSTYYQEQYGRSPNFDATLPNAVAGGHPGATEYQATCGCQLAKNYPWGFGPRLGFAYQFLPKTVFRGGFGIVYAGTGQGSTFGGGVYGTASANNPFGPSGVPGAPIMTLDNIAVNGNPITQGTIAWPNLSSSYYPIGGVLPGAGPQSYDPNGGRPPRQYQYSAGIQREVLPNLVVDASYVGNYGIWWYTAALTNLNYLSTSILSANGLSLNNPANLATLLAPIGSAAAGVFQNKIPFAGFPLTATVAQSLRPFPQFNSGLNVLSAPLGDVSYNALQAQVNKRFSHGFQMSYSLVWQKNMDTFGGTGTPDIQNRGLDWKLDPTDQPLVSKISYAYTTPKWGNKWVSQAVRDWTVTGFLQYASGTLFAVPTANTVGYPSNLTTATIAGLTFQPNANPQYEVAGQPLYLNSLNCHCFNPNTSIVLNPAAWANPGPGQFGGAANTTYFSGERRPVENMGLGRMFRIKERVSMNLRVEFVNVFNRTYLNNPTLTSPQTAPVCVLPNGTDGACNQPGLQTVSGFGTINTTTTLYPPRVGQLIARFQF